MNIRIFCHCNLFPSWSGYGLISTPVILQNTHYALAILKIHITVSKCKIPWFPHLYYWSNDILHVRHCSSDTCHTIYFACLYLYEIIWVEEGAICLTLTRNTLQKKCVSNMVGANPRNSFLTFCWSRIVIYTYNKNQQDELFTFNLFQ
jgi:hypothetical protein